jgi:predicted TIM-barrel fold metal-dependent hydrolase
MQRRTVLAAAAAAGVLASSPSGPAAAAEIGEDEAPLLPELPIIDAHHHLYAFPASATAPARQYLLPDLLKDIDASGHRVVATCAVEDYAMYRADGPAELRSLGETEFVNGIAAMAASGVYGPCRVAAGFVGFVDLRLAERLRPVLEAHIAAAGGRLRAIRNASAWDPYPVFGKQIDPTRFALLRDPDFRRGAAQLAPLGLAFDAFCFHTQLDDVADLAAALPDTAIVLNHLGTPLGIGPYAGRRDEVFAVWKAKMKALSAHPNVSVKIGGLGMAMTGLPSADRKPRARSAVLADEWRPYVQTCIDAFGVHRCMFESNYPPDGATATYGGVWNTFKRLTADYSPAERAALFAITANRVYRLGVQLPA